MDRRVGLGVLVLAVAVAGAVVGLAPAAEQPAALSPAPAPPPARQLPQSSAEIRLSFAPIVKRVAPAVVNVYASRVVRQQVSPFFNDPFFRRFFGDQEDFGQPSQRVQRALGSGVFVDPSGIIVTNNHVIANADEVKIALSDGREFPCDVILKDERTDLAVLKVRGASGPFPTLDFADSDEVEVGDLVLAIGDPFGVGQTVTSGIVSALARTRVGVSDYQFFIQTDAAINPGNSGGALIDMNGRLVGINTAIFSPSGGSNGVGFAIPSNMVRVVAASAKTGGAVRLPWVGASFQAVTAELADSLGLSELRGALVADVVKDSPGYLAGLKTGDLVTAIDSVAVDDPSSLNYRIATKGIGPTVKLAIVRAGKNYTASLVLTAAPETVPRAPVKIVGSPLDGATVVNLSPAVAEEMSFRGDPKGVIISEVPAGSIAERTGFARGDVVVDVNGVAIATTKSLAEAASQDTGVWRMTIDRKGQIIRSQFQG
jgi:Do/DeqQ family serine protease